LNDDEVNSHHTRSDSENHGQPESYTNDNYNNSTSDGGIEEDIVIDGTPPHNGYSHDSSGDMISGTCILPGQTQRFGLPVFNSNNSPAHLSYSSIDQHSDPYFSDHQLCTASTSSDRSRWSRVEHSSKR
jgi:hypothetical protein